MNRDLESQYFGRSLTRRRFNSVPTDVLTENKGVEVLKFQMPSFKTYAEIDCRMKVRYSQTFVIVRSCFFA